MVLPPWDKKWNLSKIISCHLTRNGTSVTTRAATLWQDLELESTVWCFVITPCKSGYWWPSRVIVTPERVGGTLRLHRYSACKPATKRWPSCLQQISFAWALDARTDNKCPFSISMNISETKPSNQRHVTSLTSRLENLMVSKTSRRSRSV